MDIIKRLNNTKSIWSIIPGLTSDELEEVITIAADAYYNTAEELISDNIYDVLIERLKIVNPKSKLLSAVGSAVHGEKTKLPVWMGSMDKIKGDQTALNSWTEQYQGPYVISYKVDGISALYVKTKKEEHLYTRGKGNEGTEITHMLQYCNMGLSNVPDNTIIRGELIMSKTKFTKYENFFSNARAMVSGVVVSKPESMNRTYAKDIDFLSFEVIEPVVKPSKQFELLQKWNTNVIYHDVYDFIEMDLLEDLFEKAKKSYPYEIDGIIVTDNNDHKRNTSGNPSYSFAFKGLTPTAQTKVIDVYWTPSKDGILVPRIHYQKVKLSGVEMEYTTGFNAAFIENNEIGPGAIITVIRSGDVIPYIIDVVKPSKDSGLPGDCEYSWDKNHVNIIINDKDDNDTVTLKLMTKFFKDIGVKHLSEGLISRLYENGYNDVMKVLKMTVDDFLTIDGFKETMANKIYNGIQSKLHNMDILQLMVASNLLGRGFAEKKLKKILTEYPNIVDEYDSDEYDEWKEVIIDIDGFDEITATQFLDNMEDFQEFYTKIKKIANIKPFVSKVNEKGSYQGQVIVFTGFKNAEWKKIIENEGGKVTESVSKTTTLVVHKDGETTTSKYTKAKKLGIKLMTQSAFEKMIDSK